MGFVAGPPPVPEPSRHERYCDAREYLIDRYGGMTGGVGDINWKSEFEDLLWTYHELKGKCEHLELEIDNMIPKEFCQRFLDGSVSVDDFVNRVMGNDQTD